jgi:hypothetical protein
VHNPEAWAVHVRPVAIRFVSDLANHWPPSATQDVDDFKSRLHQSGVL